MSNTTSTLDIISTPPAENGRVDAPARQIHIIVSEDRAQQLKVGIMRKVEKDINAQIKFIAHFVCGPDGRYLEADEALAVIDDLSVSELAPLIERVTGDLEGAAAKKKSATTSTSMR